MTCGFTEPSRRVLTFLGFVLYLILFLFAR